MQEIANYLPSLAGAIILLTLGVALINILVDYIQRQVGGASSPFMASVFNILKFGLYAVIIKIAVQLAIFYWIHFINPYLFYDIIIASVIKQTTNPTPGRGGVKNKNSHYYFPLRCPPLVNS
jgi:Conserved TM helix.